jgi:PAS domain S-box-containing protein
MARHTTRSLRPVPQYQTTGGAPSSLPKSKVSVESRVSPVSIIEQSPDAIVVADATGRILLVNRRTEVLFGYSRQELMSQSIELLLSEWFARSERRPSPRTHDGAPGARPIQYRLERLGRSRDGREFPVEISLGPMFSQEEGDDPLVINCIREVSELNQVQEGQAAAPATPLQSEEWFRSMADTAPVLLWVAGTDALVTFVNVPWLRFTGRRVEQELGNGWTEGVHPDDYQRCLETYLTAFHARQSFTMEYRLRRFDGEYRWLVDTGVPRFAQDGSFEGYIGSAIDITEREQLKQEREEAEAREWAASEVAHHMDQFFAVAAHDIRSPVTAVVGNVQLAQRRVGYLQEALHTLGNKETAIVEPVVESLTAARTSVDRLVRLTNLLFDVAQARGGTLEVRLIPCDLAMAVQEQVTAQRLAASGRTIYLEKPDTPVLVIGDADRLGQVLSNYISNALKYSADDQPVRVLVELDGGTAIVSVQDKGRGLPAEEQEQVWDLFHRVPGIELQSSTGGGGSLGLGLYISKRIVELHHGQVGVESEEGQGSTFWFRLPLATDATAV